MPNQCTCPTCGAVYLHDDPSVHPTQRSIPRDCAACGKALLVRPSGLRARNFCSRACRYEGQRKTGGFPAIIDGEIAKVPLFGRDGTVRGYAIVDRADAAFVSQWEWRVSSDGYANRAVWEGGKVEQIPLTRALLGLVRGDGLVVDHIDGVRLHDRRANLRIITAAQNAQNRRSLPGSSSQYRGVTWEKRARKWRVLIIANKQRHHLGLFTDEAEAGRVAREARARLLPYAVD